MAKVDTYQHPELGQALRFLRARAGLSQARVAREVSARGGRLTAVWLSRIESAADRGGGPYPSVALLDRVLTVLGSSREALEALLRERPWARVGEGAEWDDTAGASGAAGGAGAPSPGAAAEAAGLSPGSAAGQDVAAEAAELGARYARLRREEQLALLARVRELS